MEMGGGVYIGGNRVDGMHHKRKKRTANSNYMYYDHNANSP